MPGSTAAPIAARLPRARVLWRQVHLWVGLVLGFVVALVGLSGSLLVFQGPMIRAEQGAIVAPDPAGLAQGDWAPLADWMANARARYPDLGHVDYVVAPDAAPVPSTAPLLVAHVHGVGPDGAETWHGHRVIGMDPVSAAPLGEFVFEETWTGRISTFHTALLAGTFGSELVNWSSLAALTLSIGSGLWLWWPRNAAWRQALSIKRGARGRRRHLDLHNATAVWLLAPLVVVLASGLYIVRPGWFNPGLEFVSELREPDYAALASAERPDCGGLSPDAALAAAQARHPDNVLRIMYIPEDPREPYYLGLMRPGADPKVMATELWIDRSCPTVLFERRGDDLTAAETVLSWNARLHADLGLGRVGQALVAATGLLLPLLWVTGLLLWLGRRRRTNQSLPDGRPFPGR